MKALKLYTHKRFVSLELSLACFPSDNAKTSIHRIRLSIKKIKAILRLIHFHDKDFRHHKHYKPFRHIFRKAGNIRKADIIQELLLQYTEIKNPVVSSAVKPTKKFEENLSGFVKDVLKQHKIIFKEVSNIKSCTYKSYLQKKNKALNEFLAKPPDENELHFLRKMVKEVIYLNAVTTKKARIDPFLLEIEKLIGNWHDKKVLMDWLRDNMPAEHITIEQLNQNCLDDVENINEFIKNRTHSSAS